MALNQLKALRCNQYTWFPYTEMAFNLQFYTPHLTNKDDLSFAFMFSPPKSVTRPKSHKSGTNFQLEMLQVVRAIRLVAAILNVVDGRLFR